MSLYSLLSRNGPSGYGYGSTAEDVTAGLDLGDRTFLVTGCNSGLGHETMRVLALRGATVLGAARTQSKAERACAAVGGDTHPVTCELSEPRSVRACADAVRDRGPLHGIICNAGIMALPELQRKYGYELQFFTNHVGHFILVTSLLERLAEGGRVVMLSSGAHHSAPADVGIDFDNLSGERSYKPWTAYGQSKLANLLFAKELARRFEGTGRTANAVHPGVIATNLGRHMNPVLMLVFGLVGPLVFLKSVPQGAATQTYVATHPDLAGVRGEYFKDCNVAKPSRHARDPELAERLWTETERIVAELG